MSAVAPPRFVARARSRWPLAPRTVQRVAVVAAAMLTLIVLTGAAVRVTGSGLGCPTWPKCDEKVYTETLSTHGVIEFGNRLLTSVIGFACLAALVAAALRRPFRRDLLLLALPLPFGVLGQAVLGGLTVLYGLSPGWVMAHFLLSMVILVPAVALVVRAGRDDDAPAPAAERGIRRLVAGVVALGAVTLTAGTAATAAGPLTGGEGTNDIVPRFDFAGADTLDLLIHWHGRIATVLGLLALAALWRVRKAVAAGRADRPLLTALLVVTALLGAQGVVGGVQYALELPAEIVWVHVALAATTWVAIVWAACRAGLDRRLPAG